jgi:hypothetical protein
LTTAEVTADVSDEDALDEEASFAGCVAASNKAAPAPTMPIVASARVRIIAPSHVQTNSHV